ncbi:hypothetical protein D9M70_332160 [compost metagenome]
MRDHRLRVFLEVVRWQHVLGRRHEGLEKAPGATRRAPQGQGIGELGRAGWHERWAAAGAPGQGRRREPERQQEQRHGPCRGREHANADGQRHGQQHAAGHLPIEARYAGPRASGGLGGGCPFQQVPMGRVQPDQGARDGVHRAPGLVRQQGQRPGCLQRGHPQIAGQQAQVAAQPDARARWPQPREAGQEGRPSQCQHQQPHGLQ